MTRHHALRRIEACASHDSTSGMQCSLLSSELLCELFSHPPGEKKKKRSPTIFLIFFYSWLGISRVDESKSDLTGATVVLVDGGGEAEAAGEEQGGGVDAHNLRNMKQCARDSKSVPMQQHGRRALFSLSLLSALLNRAIFSLVNRFCSLPWRKI